MPQIVRRPLVIAVTASLSIGSFLACAQAPSPASPPAAQSSSPSPQSSTAIAITPPASAPKVVDIPAFCREQLAQLQGPYDKTKLDPACLDAKVLEGCESNNGTPIYHIDREGQGGQAQSACFRSHSYMVMNQLVVA